MKTYQEYFTTLNEMPQLISKVDSMTIDQAEKECIFALKRGLAKEISRLSNHTCLYQISGCYFLATDNHIDYIVKYQSVELNEKLLQSKYGIRQILIKRFSNASVFASGIGADIFWNHLFPMTKCLISDSQQTDNGKQFWEYRIAEAIKRKLTIQMINTNDNTSVEVKTMPELAKLQHEIWGTSKWFKRIILVIKE